MVNPLLEAHYEVLVYLHNFHNLDLLQQGWYAIRVRAHWEGSNQLQGVVSRVLQFAPHATSSNASQSLWHINEDDQTFRTHVFLVKYSRQDIVLRELVGFSLALDGLSEPSDKAIIIDFQLLFGASQKDPTTGTPTSEPPADLAAVASQSFRVLPSACAGLHSYCPLQFDAWHMVLVDCTIHSVLLGYSYSSKRPQEDSLLLSPGPSVSPSPSRHDEDSGSEQGWETPTRKPIGLKSPLAIEVEDGSRTPEAASPLGGRLASPMLGSPLPRTPSKSRFSIWRSRSKNSKTLDHSSLKFLLVQSQRALRDELSLARKLTAIAAKEELSERFNGDAGTTDEESSWQGSPARMLDSPGSDFWQEDCDELARDIVDSWAQFIGGFRESSGALVEKLRTAWQFTRAIELGLWVVNARSMLEGSLSSVRNSPDTPKSKSKFKLPPNVEAADAASAMRAAQYRASLVNLTVHHCLLQDMRIFGSPESQPILFVERFTSGKPEAQVVKVPQRAAALLGANGTPPRTPNSSRALLGGLKEGRSPTAEETSTSGTHVVVFVHGFQGHHLDLRLLRNHWLMLDPEIECLMSQANQDKTFDNLADMGHRLASEIVAFLEKNFGTLDKPHPRHKLSRISFAAHSIGNLIARSSLVDDLLSPYLDKLYTYVSVSGPQMGYLYSPNTVFNSGLWLLKTWKKSPCMHQLTFTDSPDLSDCYLYYLTQRRTLDLFKNVVLLASPQDKYVPYHSARVEMCPAALRDGLRGTVYAQMVKGTLGCLIRNNAADTEEVSRGKTLIRCDVNFDMATAPRNLNTMLGRTAHIDFLETDVYIRFLMWSCSDVFL